MTCAGVRWTGRVGVTLAIGLLVGCGGGPQGARTSGGPSGPVGAPSGDPLTATGSDPLAAAGPIAAAGPLDANTGNLDANTTETPGGTAAGSTGAGGGSTTAARVDLTEPFSCPNATVTALDSKGLIAALKNAKPGDVIWLDRGSYGGNFTIKAKGTAQRPIYLCGPPNAVLSGQFQNSGYTLHLDGARNWRLQGFTVRKGQKGVMLDASSDNVLQDLRIENTGDEALHLRKNSTGNVVQRVVIKGTGSKEPKFGEGIYVGTATSNWCKISACGPDRSDRNILIGNRINATTAEAIDIKEGTSSGVVADNTFDGRSMVAGAADSWVDVKGNGWLVSHNVGDNSLRDGFQVHVIVPGWGDGNVFSRNVSRLGKAGVGIWLQTLGKNRISCDNSVEGGTGPSNVGCSD